MRILVFMGSPNRPGSTSTLVDAFERGAQKAGHDVIIANICTLDLLPCLGCDDCGKDYRCVQDDKLYALKNYLFFSDMLVFATPVYYGGMTSQLKCAIDRLRSIEGYIIKSHLHSALIAVSGSMNPWVFEPLVSHYDAIVDDLNLADEGMVLGLGCSSVEKTMRSEALDRAYRFGRGLQGEPF